MQDETRWCEDIKMFAIDRPIFDIEHGGQITKGSCTKFATNFCKMGDKPCFNLKLMKVYTNMRAKDIRNEKFWQHLRQHPEDLRRILQRKHKSIKRFRFMTRGEAITDMGDLLAIRSMVLDNPETNFWLPTKAWRDPALRAAIKNYLFPLPNLATSASIDPDTEDEWEALALDGWATMYYGDDSRTTTTWGTDLFKCPKTHKKLKICDTCKGGCFKKLSAKKQPAHVHLSFH